MIDIHTHLWPAKQSPDYLKDYFERRQTPSGLSALTHEGLLRSMDQAGILQSAVSALCFGPEYSNEDLRPFNDYVREEVSRAGGRLLAFCTIHPFEDGALRYLRGLIEDRGFKGLKLHCNMQRFYPDDRRLYPIYRQMQEYRLPILFHSGGIGLPPIRDCYGQPICFDPVACDFPKLPIILGHAGRIWYDETAMLMRKHPNLYADISTNLGRLESHQADPLAALLKKVKVWAGQTDRLLFGSDYPFYDQETTKSALLSLGGGLPPGIPVTPEDIDGVVNRNAACFWQKYHLS